MLVLLVVVGACGDEDDRLADDLDGRVFLSEAVAGRELVPDTQVRLSFEDGRVGASAGCNSMGGPYELDGDQLVVTELSTTEMGCDPPRHDQDAWLAGVLQGRPTVAVDGDSLTLATADVTLRLVDRRVVDPDRPLGGTTWRVDTVITGDAASSVPDDAPVTLVLDDAGTLTAESTGCTSVRVDVEVDDDVLRFGPVSVDDIACPAPWATTLDVLGAGEATWSITAARLTIQAGDLGIAAVADEG